MESEGRLLTEEEWLGCADPWAMLRHVNWLWQESGQVSDRRLMLFAVAIAHVWGMGGMDAQFDWSALEKAERYAAGLARKKDLQRHWKNPFAPVQTAIAHVTDIALIHNQLNAQYPERANRPDEVKRICDFFRTYFGNPFRPVEADPSWSAWRDGAIPTLARTIYEERCWLHRTLDAVRLAKLADMLEEAGGADASLLDHLWGPGPHVRGCWSVDLIIGQS